jgi:hypothetical protein
MRMQPPQHGQGCSGAFGSSGFVVAALMASIGMSGSAEQGADTCDVVGVCRAVSRPLTDAVGALWHHMHQEAADERVGVERHHPVSVPAGDPQRRYLLRRRPDSSNRQATLSRNGSTNI